MILVDYTLDHPILDHTRDHVPGVEIVWEESHTGPDGARQFLAWIECDDFEELDRALRADPTVKDDELLTETEGRRLYRFTLTGEGRATDIMPLLMEVGGVHRDLRATNGGWRNRTRFPSRKAFERVRRFCRDNDIGLTFHRIWEESDRYGGKPPSLTQAQHETLVAAVERGYLEIPRECSLADLGDHLGVSETATSERFRRGVKTLVVESLRRSER